MKKRHHTRKIVELTRLWRQWTGLVSQVLRRRWGWKKVSSAEYKKVHGQLLDVLTRATAHPLSAAPLKQQDLLELQEFCSAWVNLDALERADRRLLLGVVSKSEELCLQHFGCKSSSRLVTHILQLVAMTSVLTIVVAGMVGNSWLLSWNGNFRGEIQSEIYRIWFTIGQYSGLHWLGIATGVVVLVGTWMLSSTLKA